VTAEEFPARGEMCSITGWKVNGTRVADKCVMARKPGICLLFLNQNNNCKYITNTRNV
jgi:hypothetical protein